MQNCIVWRSLPAVTLCNPDRIMFWVFMELKHEFQHHGYHGFPILGVRLTFNLILACVRACVCVHVRARTQAGLNVTPTLGRGLGGSAWCSSSTLWTKVRVAASVPDLMSWCRKKTKCALQNHFHNSFRLTISQTILLLKYGICFCKKDSRAHCHDDCAQPSHLVDHLPVWMWWACLW